LEEKKMMSQTKKQVSWRAVSVFGVCLSLALGLSVEFWEKAAAHDNDEAAVREVLQKSALGFAKNDVDMVTNVWANDEMLTVFESGHANYGWADYRDHHLLPEMKEFKNTKYELSDMKIHLAGKTAWATFKYTISGDVEQGGATRHVDGAGLGTAVLEERQGQWRIVHWHSSAPRRAPAASSAKN
jgi:ketosteroid isomerase-like protein